MQTDEKRISVYKIALAGYFHDIGKFAERANMGYGDFFEKNHAGLYQPEWDGRFTHKHALYTAAFIDHCQKLLPSVFNSNNWCSGGVFSSEDSFINLAAKHHKPETALQWIIARADRASSGFEREEFDQFYNKEVKVTDFKKTRLLAILEGIDLEKAGADSRLEGKGAGTGNNGMEAGDDLKKTLQDYRYRYPLSELTGVNIFPLVRDGDWLAIDSQEAEIEYQKLFDRFCSALGELAHKDVIELWFEHFDSLFMTYTSHIPSATVGFVVPDISLYDHCRSTAAIASALYLYHLEKGTLCKEKIEASVENDKEKKFRLIHGDFYGIQDFIFTEGGSTSRNAAKMLRGRSFYVSLLSELAADMLVRELDLTPASIVMNAAGKFTIIAPNLQGTVEKIRAVEKEINDWLVKRFYGECAIGFSHIEASIDDFSRKNFKNLFYVLMSAAAERKLERINLFEHGGVVGGYLDSFFNEYRNKICPYCEKRPSTVESATKGNDGEECCGICRDQIYLGTYLVKADRLAITTTQADIHGDKLVEPIFDRYQLSLDVTGKLSDLAKSGTLLKYWDISAAKRGAVGNITAKFLNGYVPVFTEQDQSDESLDRILRSRKTEQKKEEMLNYLEENLGLPKTFHHLASAALNCKYAVSEDGSKKLTGKYTGVEALAILKADVDNLGAIFSYGLERNSLARQATLSRQVNNFFAVYLPYFLSTSQEYRDIYTVFAGGDDLFLIGPWNVMTRFAIILRNKFSEYVCQNPYVTLSAGITINKPGEPVPLLAERSENALEQAKRTEREEGNKYGVPKEKSRKVTKNAISIFDETVGWDEYIELDRIYDTLEKWLKEGKINNAMLFRLNYFCEMVRREKLLLSMSGGVELDEWECLKWPAKFKYTLARNVGQSLPAEKKAEAIAEVERAAEWFRRFGSAIRIPIWRTIYENRNPR